jgi:peptidoglycan/LPS O-acetylase OafA/YrhL
MGYYSIWPYFVGMSIVLLLASTPLLSWASSPPTAAQSRIRTLDGLRGFLALGVVFHHAAIYHEYIRTGAWVPPPSRFYAGIGPIGVALFFMITGYLFWTQMLIAHGRPNFLKLYLGRIFRIVPLYTFLAVVLLATVGIMTQLQLREAPLVLLGQVAGWLAGGVLAGQDVNGYPLTGEISAFVTWTLRYEWAFYGTLLLTSFFGRRLVSGILFPVVTLLIAGALLVIHPGNRRLAVVATFGVGMIAAAVSHVAQGRAIALPQWLKSVAAAACLVTVFLVSGDDYTLPPILILGVVFALLVFDTTLFGVLLSEPARRLGNISYGIYLLQGPILFAVFTPARIRALALASPWGHWAVVISATLVLVLVATATHAGIERPWIDFGRRMWARLSATSSRAHSIEPKLTR